MEYTKGKWEVEVSDSYTTVEAGCQTICSDVSNCDANLIAAAPDMYEALKGLLWITDVVEPTSKLSELRATARQALAKADVK